MIDPVTEGRVWSLSWTALHKGSILSKGQATNSSPSPQTSMLSSCGGMGAAPLGGPPREDNVGIEGVPKL